MGKGERVWVKGLVMATISGAAGGFGTGLSAIVVAPGLDAASTAKMVIASAVIAAATGLFGYLKQSPLPPPEDAAADSGGPAA